MVVDPAALPFRFRVEEAFTLTGRGTVVAGTIEQGRVSRGDRLRRLERATSSELVCAAVEMLDRRKGGEWVSSVGLLFPDLPKAEIEPGDVLVHAD